MAVQRFLTGYADDFTIHRTIYSRADLTAALSMISRLLESVARLQLRVNPSKCVILVKLVGVEAPAVTKRHTCWLPDAQGTLQKCWRLGRNKTFKAFRWESSTKYLGIIISYGSFEMLTLKHRIAEAAKNVQQVRRFIYNRRIASPKARLRVWFTTVWATLVTGLPEVGLTEDTARQLRGWYAFKIRSVLNQPAHVSRLPTTDLFALHGILDPVKILDDRMQSRLRKLRTRSNNLPQQTSAPTAGVIDITVHPLLLQSLDDILQELRTLPELKLRRPSRPLTAACIVMRLSPQNTVCACT